MSFFLFSALKKPKHTIQLLGALLRDPGTFWRMTIALRRYQASQKPLELFALIRFLKRRRLATIMEIGTRHGGSLYVWCRLAESNAHLVSLDFHPKGNDEELVARFQAFKAPGQTMTCIRQDSHLPQSREAIEEALDGRRLDFLFIDADHSYEGVKQDFEMYSPFVAPGGMVAFEDIVENSRYPKYGAARFWQELRGGYENFEFVNLSHPMPGHGIGVLVMP